MAEVGIGLLRPDEAEALAELADRIWHAHYRDIIPPAQIEYMLRQRYRPDLVRQLMARGDQWLVARAGEALIGFAHGYPLSESDYKLDKLYVHPDWQRHGIGGRLIGELAARARAHGCNRLVLRVNRNNRSAIQAYLKYGFQVVTSLVEDIGGGFVMDDHVMVSEIGTA